MKECVTSKIMKKLAIVLILCAGLLGIMAVVSSAETVASGTCGDSLTWDLNDDGLLMISGTGDMDSFANVVNQPWYENRSAIKTVIIEDGVTSVGSQAFYNCKNITSVRIPEGVSRISGYTFGNCSALEKIHIPSSVSLIQTYAFDGCSKLKHVFYGGNSTTQGTINIGSTGNDYVLLAIWIYDANDIVQQDGVVYAIGNEYAQVIDADSSLSGFLTIPEKVCELPIKRIAKAAFYDCTNLTGVVIPEGVSSIEARGFYQCSNLTSIIIPDSVEQIGEYAFHYCDSLKYVGYYGNEEQRAAISMSIYNSNLTEAIWAYGAKLVVEQDKIVYAVLDDYACVLDADVNLSGEIVIEQLIQGVPVISVDANAFEDCIRLTSVVIPDSVTSIGEYAFYDCTGLKSVSLPIGLQSIGEYAFLYCSSLESIDIPGSVTNIAYKTFFNCSNLQKVTIFEGVKSIGNSVFIGCSSLAEIKIPKSVMSIGEYAFYECDSLKDVYYKGTQEEWNSIVIDRYNDSLKNAILHPKKAITITDFTKADNITFTANLTSADRGLLIVARYGENGKNLGMKIYTAAAQVPVSIANDCETVKVMWWDGFITMRILAPVVELDI